MKYCAHKNDLLLCVNRPLFKKSSGFLAKNAAYPYVLSTLGGVSEYVKHAIAAYYSLDDPHVTDEQTMNIMKNYSYDTEAKERLPAEQEYLAALKTIERLPFFTFMGYSLGLAYAHPSSGDNVVSAMVGGMISVQNGHFQVHTGDIIMWYFDFERPYFTDDGGRPNDAWT
eukprot:3311092-Rhodomonas_salina.1